MADTVAKCSCGRPTEQASWVVQRINETRYTYFRCECGKEWTKVELDDHKQNDPITSGEVIAVHERLLRFEGTLKDLLKG